MTRKPETISFWRGRLPHWEVVGGRYFVTIHLAGAIPRQGQERIHELASAFATVAKGDTEGWLRVQRRIYAEMESWLDKSESVSHLRQSDVARMVMEAVAFRHGRTWTVFEFVVMPSHVHLFFELLDDSGLKGSLERFKQWTGHRAAELLRLGGRRFWQDEWFDHWSRSDEEDERIGAYIRHNPVKAGLVREYRDWSYGSWASSQVPLK